MLDLSNCKELLNHYAGSEKKKTIIFDDEIYMLKFPDPIREKSKYRQHLYYANNQYSEYIGCHVAKALGLKVQDTFLVTYTDGDKTKVCVACRDFANDGLRLCEFSAVTNSITSCDDRFSTNIEDVYLAIDKLDFLKDKQKIIDGFWDIFVLDVIIGNKDRHLDNWGLVEDNLGEVFIAPIYDCGSCLFPLLSEDQMKELYYDATKLKSLSYNVTSVYKYKGKRIFYHDMANLDIPDLNRAIIRVGSNFDLDGIRHILDEIPNLSKQYKEVCLRSMEIRYDHFIKDMIMENEIKERLEL